MSSPDTLDPSDAAFQTGMDYLHRRIGRKLAFDNRLAISAGLMLDLAPTRDSSHPFPPTFRLRPTGSRFRQPAPGYRYRAANAP